MTNPTSKPVRTGSDRSIEILDELTDARIRAVGSPASQPGCQRSELATRSVLRHSTRRLSHRVARRTRVGAPYQRRGRHCGDTDRGVWLLNNIVWPTALAGYTGNPLSEAWDSPDISCLAWGPERTQVYVGTGAQAIFLLEFETVLGGHLTLKQSTTLPVPFGGVSAIVTLTNPRCIVATVRAGSGGRRFRSQPANLSGYNWQRARGCRPPSTAVLRSVPSGSVAVTGLSGVSTHDRQDRSLALASTAGHSKAACWTLRNPKSMASTAR